jgi:membrane protein implicated in regulation of membrane protease activity
MWFILGFAFFILEFLLPGFILFFFGIGAWVVALATLFTDLSFNVQIILFLVSAILTVLSLRKWLREKLGMGIPKNSDLEDEFIGRHAIVEQSISPGMAGQVSFKGTSWQAEADEEIPAGASVTIIDTKSIVLIVKSNL